MYYVSDVPNRCIQSDDNKCECKHFALDYENYVDL